MNWQDKGFLLSKNKYNENSTIAEIFTENHGKVSGLIFGSTSKKIKNYLLIGNNFHINYNSKNVNKIGINFFLNAPSIKKNVKNTRFNIETGLPPWNIPFEVPENLYDSRPYPKK